MRRINNPFPFDIVWVKWDDAESDYGWEKTSALAPEEAIAHTVGFLVKETDTHIVVASTMSHDEDEGHTTNNRLQIPRGMVKDIRVIKHGTSKKQSTGNPPVSI
jgi:hypothetical protein